MQPLETIESFVAPVVMISANGLLCLALYNRLAAIVSRTRTINKERFDQLARLAVTPPAVAVEAEHLRRRAAMLDEMGHQLFDRVRMLRDSLICLLLSVLVMLGCSLALGLAPMSRVCGPIALVLFVSGAAVMFWGIVLAIQELRVSLDPLTYEHAEIERWLHPQNDENGAENGTGAIR